MWYSKVRSVLLNLDSFLGLLSSKTKPVASVSGQSSGCCITPTGYRAQRGGASAVQPLNLSQVSARGCYLLFTFFPVVTLWRTLLLAGPLNKAKWSSFCVKPLVFCGWRRTCMCYVCSSDQWVWGDVLHRHTCFEPDYLPLSSGHK